MATQSYCLTVSFRQALPHLYWLLQYLCINLLLIIIFYAFIKTLSVQLQAIGRSSWPQTHSPHFLICRTVTSMSCDWHTLFLLSSGLQLPLHIESYTPFFEKITLKSVYFVATNVMLKILVDICNLFIGVQFGPSLSSTVSPNMFGHDDQLFILLKHCNAKACLQ